MLLVKGHAAHLAKERLRRTMARAVAGLALLLALLLFALMGLAFAVTALFFWLDYHLNAPLAALTVAGIMFGICLLILLVWSLATRRTRPRPPAGNDASGDEAARLLAQVGQDLKQSVEKKPGSAVLVALLVGLVVGLWRR